MPKPKTATIPEKKVTLIQLFASSPGDVQPERDCVPQVAERLNRNLGDFLKIRLEVLDWRTNVYPDMGRPQEVINQQIRDYDIFLGIMWKRFGSPTGKADFGTEEEFRIAYKNWKKYRRPRILIYFKQEPFMPRTPEENEQFGKVLAFKSEFWDEKKGLVWEFPATPDFKEIIYDHLSKILLKKFQPVPGATRPPDFTRYLESLRDETRYLDIRGLAARNQPNQFQINQLYIPLTTHAFAKSGKSRSEAINLPTEVPLPTALKFRRLLIKGDPGAGKTTFLRLLVFHLASRHLGEVVPIGETRLDWPEPLPLPVWVRLGELCDFIQKQQQNHAESAPVHPDNPEWLVQFLADRAEGNNWKVTSDTFKQELDAGRGLILLDGLDEAPDEKVRRNIADLTGKICHAYPNCQVIITSRPVALEDVSLPPGFEPVDITELSEHSMKVFLEQWCRQLYPEAPEKSAQHLAQLTDALHTRPEIRQMARTPVMLTLLAVIHWNENKLPEQRAELYKAIIRWLLESKANKPGRLSAIPRQKLLQTLALAMFCHPDGRQRQVGLRWAAEPLQAKFTADNFNSPLELAEQFLRQEMLDSGVIVERNRRLEFWHLSFQEYLAAVEIGGMVNPDDRVKLLFEKDRLFQSEWREVVLLLAGVLYDNGEEQINHLFDQVIHRELPDPAEVTANDLPRLARAAGLLGSMVRDLAVFKFQPKNPAYPKLVQQVLGIFDKQTYQSVPLRIRIEAADALGQVGDPRFQGDPAARWVNIPGGTFRMGAQTEKGKPNYYAAVSADESPVHQVKLSPYCISKYPVTVGEYQHFVTAGGYEQKNFWVAGGFKKYTEPANWADQQAFPTRPVVYVSWYEAAAYATWAGCRLPTEAEWERAARGPGEYRKYPWGDKEPKKETTNWGETGLTHVSPVGIFPADCSPEGVRELAGNVLEWCGDWYDPDYYATCQKKGTIRNPIGPEQGDGRVLRGGSFYGDVLVSLRCADRGRYHPDYRSSVVGFRVVRAS